MHDNSTHAIQVIGGVCMSGGMIEPFAGTARLSFPGD
jgi:hypothetical protein